VAAHANPSPAKSHSPFVSQLLIAPITSSKTSAKLGKQRRKQQHQEKFSVITSELIQYHCSDFTFPTHRMDKVELRMFEKFCQILCLIMIRSGKMSPMFLVAHSLTNRRVLIIQPKVLYYPTFFKQDKLWFALVSTT